MTGGRAAKFESALAFLATAALVCVYCFRGATYDVIARQEAGIAIWWILALGVATGLLPRARMSRATAVVLGGFALLTAITLAGFSWTDSAERSHVELARTLHHAGLFLLAAACLGPRSWRAAVHGVAAAAALVCAVALGSRLFPAAFPADGVRATFGTNRLNYPLNYWNAMSAWGAFTVTLLLALSAHARSAAARGLLLAAVPVAIAMTYVTYSRAGVAGVALGLLAAWALSPHRALLIAQGLVAAAAGAAAIATIREQPEIVQAVGGAGGGSVVAALGAGCAACALAAWGLHAVRAGERLRMPRRTARISAGATAAVLVVAAAVWLPGLADRGWDEFRDQTLAPSQASIRADPAARLVSLTGARYRHYESALDAFETQPLRGLGAGTFEFWWNRSPGNVTFVRDAHSLHLEALAELGLIGFLAILLVSLGALGAAVATRVSSGDFAEAGAAAGTFAAVAVWLLHAAVDWMWEATAVTAAALLLAAAAAQARSEGAAPRRLPLRAGLAGLAVVAVLAQLPVLVATSQVRASQEAARLEDPQKALAKAQDAVGVFPWAASPYVQRALLAEERGDLAAAEADVRRALDREPTNWRHPLLLARIEAEQGDAQAALAAFRRARELRPASPFFSP